MVFTPYRVAQNADGPCLIICDSTSKSSARSRRRRGGPGSDALSCRRLKYLSLEQHSARAGYLAYVTACHESHKRGCVLRYTSLAPIPAHFHWAQTFSGKSQTGLSRRLEICDFVRAGSFLRTLFWCGGGNQFLEARHSG
jgi:hypothetical protein